jgi:tetratricopeptide (TPR) repeat protein
MKRIVCRLFGAWCLLLAGVFSTVSQLPAEPIGDSDSANPPESSASPSASPEGKAAEGEKNPKIAEAVAQFKERNIENAVKLLKEAAEQDPDMPPAQIIIAQLFAQSNIAAGMRAFLDKAAFEVPEDPEAFIYLGDIAARERRITEADLLYTKAAALLDKFTKSPKRKESLQPRIFAGMANVAQAREDWAAAQKQLESLLALAPKNVAAMQQIAFCLFQQKQVDQALEKLREAAKVVPEMPIPELILAQFCQQTGDRDNAKKWLEAALAAAPKDIKVHLAIAQSSFEAGDFDAAKAEAEAAMKLDPKSFEAKVLRGTVAMFQKDSKAAEMYLESAHLQAPNEFTPGNALALTLVEQKDEKKKQRALKYAEENAQKFSKVPEALATYGWVLYKLGRVDEAERAIRSAASAGNLTATTAFYLARIAVDRGREAEARQLLEGALNTAGPFAQRQEAQALLEQLKK